MGSSKCLWDAGGSQDPAVNLVVDIRNMACFQQVVRDKEGLIQWIKDGQAHE